MDTSLVRRLLAELAGTTMLCLFGIGAAVSVAAASAGGPGLPGRATRRGSARRRARVRRLRPSHGGRGDGRVHPGHRGLRAGVSPSAPKGMHGIGIGLALATQIMVFGPLTGASVNLARTLGPNTVLSFAGESASWSQLLAYVAGPIVGGLVAAFLCDSIAAIRRSAADVTAQRA